jgi:hypothetical protein
MLKYFPRVLQIHRKNEEYAEVTFVSNYALRLGLVDYKLPRVNSLQILFFDYLSTFLFSAYTENTHYGEKQMKTKHISDYNGPT